MIVRLHIRSLTACQTYDEEIGIPSYTVLFIVGYNREVWRLGVGSNRLTVQFSTTLANLHGQAMYNIFFMVTINMAHNAKLLKYGYLNWVYSLMI